MNPPHPVPEPLKCWQSSDMPGYWKVAYIAPDKSWRYGLPIKGTSTADEWSLWCGHIIAKARRKGYDL